MRRNRFGRPVAALAVIACIGTLIPGCLDGVIREFVRYDPETDTFHFLRVYAHIEHEYDSDIDYLTDLWRNRDHLINYPELLGFQPVHRDKCGPALLRLSPDLYAVVELSSRPVRELRAEESKTALDQIAVKPGEFFRGPGGELCYYHQVSAPGSVVDRVLAAIDTRLRHVVAEAAEEELRRRREGGKRLSWDNVRKKVDELLEQRPTSTNPIVALAAPWAEFLEQQEESIDVPDIEIDLPSLTPGGHEEAGPTPWEEIVPLPAMEEASLESLLEQAKGGTAFLRRDKAIVTLTVTLSESDCREAEAYCETLKKRLVSVVAAIWSESLTLLKEELAGDAYFDKYLQKLDEAVQQQRLPLGGYLAASGTYAALMLLEGAPVAIEKRPGGKLAISLDLEEVFEVLVRSAPDMLDVLFLGEPTDEGRQEDGQASEDGNERVTDSKTLIAARKRGIPINDEITPQKIITAFHEGRLQANPSLAAVPPGEGLYRERPEHPVKPTRPPLIQNPEQIKRWVETGVSILEEIRKRRQEKEDRRGPLRRRRRQREESSPESRPEQ